VGVGLSDEILARREARESGTALESPRPPHILDAEGDAMRNRTAWLGLAVVAVLLVLGGPGMLTPAAAATPISQCMTITEAGSYELVQNLQLDNYGDCLFVQADFVTIDLKGYAIISPNRWGSAVSGFGRSLVVRGGTVYNFYTGIRGSDGLVIERMRVVSNMVGVEANSGIMGASAVVKDSVFSDNNQWGVNLSAGVVTGNSFVRNGIGVMGGLFGFPPGGSITIANNTFSQNSVGIQTQGPASIQNNTIEGGNNAMWIACPAHVVGNTVLRSSMPLMIQNNNVWDCTFDQNSIRQF
jgi:hypothetical protein